jgi:hypothetical protein
MKIHQGIVIIVVTNISATIGSAYCSVLNPPRERERPTIEVLSVIERVSHR